jgi:plasmid stabilization system protein ParE
MRVRYSPRAAQDLAAIHLYLTQHSPAGANHVLVAIYAAVEFIKRNPQAAERTPIPGVHAKVVQRYRFRIFYRLVGHDLIEIAHVRHTAREPWADADDL